MARKRKEHSNADQSRQSVSVVDVFSRRLKAWRAEQGLPLKQIAQDLGVSIAIVSEWEHGHRFPSASNLEALAKYLGLPVCGLLFYGHGTCSVLKRR